jgi:hypothetical protein
MVQETKVDKKKSEVRAKPKIPKFRPLESNKPIVTRKSKSCPDDGGCDVVCTGEGCGDFGCDVD